MEQGTKFGIIIALVAFNAFQIIMLKYLCYTYGCVIIIILFMIFGSAFIVYAMGCIAVLLNK